MTDWTEDEITALMAERDAAIARADAAEQMVAELRAVLVRRHAHDVAGGICDTPERCSCDNDVTAIIEQAAPIAGRWCLTSERDEASKRADAAIKLAERSIAEVMADLEQRGGVIEAVERALEGHVPEYASKRLTKACRRIAANEERLALTSEERDAAEQLVAEMQATFGRLLKDHHVGHGGFPRSQCGVCKPIDEALALSAPIAGRWCLASERDAAPALASLTLQLESAHREVERLRTACEKVLSWSTKDTTKLLSNPPQNAALFHAQSVLRSALVRDDSNESQ